MAVERVFLVGLSGSGKSTVGPLLARRLGWSFVDSDRLIEGRAGRSIPEIMGEGRENEPHFRQLEAEAIEEAAGLTNAVISTGAGAVVHDASRANMSSGLVIWLDVSPEIAARRLAANPETETRPMLAGDLLGRLAALSEARRPFYERSDHSVAVDYYSAEQAADRIAAIIEAGPGDGWRPDAARFDHIAVANAVAATVTTAPEPASYPIVVADGAVRHLGAVCRDAGLKGRAFVLSDRVVANFAGRALGSLEGAGFATISRAIEASEADKHLGTLGATWDWLLSERVERGDFLVCIGGGVLTDLGGFAAATVLRGIPFVHVPTTLLGMVDAAIGGKTGIDHRAGKNMIGAFAQPRAVVMDPEALATLPERELRAGWAEVVKHGLILDSRLFAELERLAGEPEAMRSARLIGWSAAIKAAVVSGDEREAGQRTLLNYGHTVGHAIEAVTGYSEYLHGEGVAIGMRAAGMIGVALGTLSADDFARQQRTIRACGLPESAPGLDVEAVLAAAAGDKKSSGGSVRWVLLRGIGEAYVHGPVDAAIVRAAVEEVCR